MLIHPSKRSKKVLDELYQRLLDYPCFQNLAAYNFENFCSLAQELFMECVLPDTVLLRQGEEPDMAYVLVQGHVQVEVTFSFSKFGKTQLKTKKMCKMGNKSLFGELSLLFNGKRTATVSSLEACYVLLIRKEPFLKYMKASILKKLNRTISFFKSLAFMETVESNVLLILASKIELQQL